jgi:hypothetical protein
MERGSDATDEIEQILPDGLKERSEDQYETLD